MADISVATLDSLYGDVSTAVLGLKSAGCHPSSLLHGSSRSSDSNADGPELIDLVSDFPIGPPLEVLFPGGRLTLDLEPLLGMIHAANLPANRENLSPALQHWFHHTDPMSFWCVAAT